MGMKTRNHASFDAQAAGYDQRTGLGVERCRAIAAAVRGKATGLVLEVGAGSGEIGQWLAAQGEYLGLDLSEQMLGVFSDRCPHALVRQADASEPWPIADAQAKVIFGSRVFHLLDASHVAGEFFRVAAPGAHLVIGRVRSEPSSIKSQMARRMRELMREEGLQSRAGKKAEKQLVEVCLAHGATLLPEHHVVSWQVSQSPAHSLASWRGKEGLGGINPAAKRKARILAKLEAWARAEFGSLQEQICADESYQLTRLALR